MDNTLYAPPRAVVADIVPGPSMARPWQVRVAVALCWLIVVLTVPDLVNSILAAVPDVSRLTAFLAAIYGLAIVVVVLLATLNVLMARGYRWARIVFSVVTLLDLLVRCQNVSVGFEQAWYFGVLNIAVTLLDIAALCLLFTGPANAWFKTRGGQIEAS
jgi:uncharacterized membrane protein YfhO